MSRPSATTLVLAAAALGSVVLVHVDPWADGGTTAPLLSTRSNARRLLPEIAERGVEGASIVIEPASGEPVRIVATGGGHEVWAGDAVLGPADPDAVQGLWASLRMATTLRAVADDAAADLGDTGRIRVTLADQTLELWLGRATPDGAGQYGGRHDPNGPEEIGGAWVIERELGALLEQAPRAWLAHRAIVVEPTQIDRIAFSDGLRIERGDDGAWRSRLGDVAAILDPNAVEQRLARLVAARLDPLIPERDAAVAIDGAPWIELATADGRMFALWRGEPCPGRPERVVVARGPGLRGCIDTTLSDPWPAVGRGQTSDGAMLHPNLLVPAYGRVLSIEQVRPEPRTLARYGGGWRIEEALAGRSIVSEVDESEVYRWYEAARAVEVSLGDPPADATVAIDLVLTTDAGTRLSLRCAGADAALRCRRDDGPWLSLRSAAPSLAFEASTFSDRRLVSLSPDDVRAIEILSGKGGARQGAHFDLGVWRLDAPAHPAGDDALDEDRLQEILAAIAGMRAEAFVDPTDDPPLRTIRIDRTPRRGEDSTIELTLWSDCRVSVAGKRPATISEGPCASLGSDLLRADALGYLLLDAQTVELTAGDAPAVRLLDDRGSLRREDGAPLHDLAATIEELQSLRIESLHTGRPTEPPRMHLRIRPRHGATYQVHIGTDWLAFDDEKWWLRTRPDDGVARDAD